MEIRWGWVLVVQRDLLLETVEFIGSVEIEQTRKAYRK